MPVTGDFAKLDKALLQLGKLGSPGLVNVCAANVGEAMVTEVRFGFRKGQDPDGNPWAPIKRQRRRKGKGKGGNKILRDTGRLANSISAQVTGGTVIVGTNVEYGPYHQYGTAGHSADFSRKQAVDSRGKFTSKLKGKRKAVDSRVLTFKEGNGAIPPRPFLPMQALPKTYAAEIAYVITQVMKRAAPGFLGAAE